MDAFRLDGAALRDFSVLVTGAGSGIGRATALTLAEAGAAHVWLVGRDATKLEATAAAIRERAGACETRLVPADLSVAADRQRLVDEVKSAGRLDALVNCAGVFTEQALRGIDPAGWRQTMEVNVGVPVFLTRDFVELLSRSPLPSVTNISSTLAVKPISNAAAYNASKAALGQVTRTLALELSGERIRVNAVLPAIVDTPMYRGRYPNADEYARSLPMVERLHPLGRMGQPQDIANAVLFLTSPAASWITGVELPVDGGMLVT